MVKTAVESKIINFVFMLLYYSSILNKLKVSLKIGRKFLFVSLLL